MNQMYKYSTVLSKVVMAALFFAAFVLASSRTFAATQTANEKFVLQGVRLSLWYEGTQQKQEVKELNVASIQEFYPEELYRALEKHDEKRLESKK